MSNKQARCALCTFCDTRQGQAGSICRMDTPKVFLVPVQTLQGGALQSTTIWPGVDPEVDYCGSFLPRDIGADEPTV